MDGLVKLFILTRKRRVGKCHASKLVVTSQLMSNQGVAPRKSIMVFSRSGDKGSHNE